MAGPWEMVIGLEVHVQLLTKTKLFCPCTTAFGAPPNANTCPVCLALPGALPVLNRGAVRLAARAAYALGCTVHEESVFARKNYFYPDLPKGYQISQFDRPLATGGFLALEDGPGARGVRIHRVHMEEDAGKSIHDRYPGHSAIDLNRSGTPLIEIVSEPDMRSSDEAYAYLTELKQTLQFVEVSTCDMEKGHLRCDANVSVRPRGAEKFGTKAEVKNLNSFRFLKQALDYEIARQVALIESGGRVIQETRLYNPDTGETVGMRSKEHAHDYRYFPEPDLVPLRVSGAWREKILGEMVEMPAARRQRFLEVYGLREYDAQVLTATRELADYFEAAAKASADPKAVANWVMGDLLGALKAEGKEIAESPIRPEQLGELVTLIAENKLSGKLAKEIFPKMLASGESAAVIMEREGLEQISDTGALEQVVDQVIAANPKQVEQYRGGKQTVISFFVGQVMKVTRGQANPGLVNGLLKKKLG